MKKIIILTVSLLLSHSILKADYWTQKADFPGINRDESFSFSIGTSGYVGCGRDSDLIPVNTFWEYDQLTNTWTQKADFAGGPRWSSTGFAVLDKGYACFGDDGTGNYQNDVWQYDPLMNNWTQKLNFPGAGRVQAVSFVIHDTAYICCGLALGPLYFNDLWAYHPLTDTWTQKTSFPGSARISPIVFALFDKGYVGCGYFYNGSYNKPKDFYEYDPVSNSWMQKADFAGPGRTQVANFALFNKGYGGTGDTSSIYYLNDFWQYNVVTDQWTQKLNVPGPGRDECISFSIGNKGYAGLGEASSNLYPNDFWEYTPDSSTGIDEFQVSGFRFEVYPNPAKEFIVISYPPAPYFSGLTGKERLEITITDVQGKKVYSQHETPNTKPETKINISNFLNGIYFIQIDNGKEKGVKKFLKK